MPVYNIIDHRTNSYRTRVTVVFEESWHDNSLEGADQFKEPDVYECIYKRMNYVTIRDALLYAEKWKNAITMHIYDMTSSADSLESDAVI